MRPISQKPNHPNSAYLPDCQEGVLAKVVATRVNGTNPLRRKRDSDSRFIRIATPYSANVYPFRRIAIPGVGERHK
ncbi:hypothetical protein CBW56_01720 [Denitratisoma oestradiolicum]|nr:hypothetical protein CBW56_01720 [Denitratisoma oestradiolicum]